MLTHPAWSPRGPRVVLASTEPASLFSYTIQGGTLQHPGPARSWDQGFLGVFKHRCVLGDALAVPPRGCSNPAVPPTSPEQLFRLRWCKKCYHGALAALGASGCRAVGFYQGMAAGRACRAVGCKLPVGLLLIVSPSPVVVQQLGGSFPSRLRAGEPVGCT